MAAEEEAIEVVVVVTGETEVVVVVAATEETEVVVVVEASAAVVEAVLLPTSLARRCTGSYLPIVEERRRLFLSLAAMASRDTTPHVVMRCGR